MRYKPDAKIAGVLVQEMVPRGIEMMLGIVHDPVFGPLIGALILQGLSEGTKLLIGKIPGLDLIIFGVLLILVVRFPLHRIPGLLAARWRGKGAP